MLKRLSVLLALSLLLFPAMASAHVVVTPKSANIGERTTFNVSVPNEKDIDVTQVKLDIPSSLQGATPTVKPGWTIQVDKQGEGESAVVKSITWTGGIIPAGQRDDFTFRSQAPTKPTQINWKAYQTYADGTVASWDQPPSAKESEGDAAGPYSVTKIVNDLAAKPAAAKDSSGESSDTLPLALSVIAVVISVGGVLLRKNS